MSGYFFVVLATLASLALPVLGVVALLTFIRRGRQLHGQEANDSLRAAVLDSLDQVHLRLDAMSERLSRVERSLEPGRDRSLAALEGEDSHRSEAAGEEPGETGGS